MKKKKLKLEQKIFISFFLAVLSLVFTLFFTTWYIFNIEIEQTENIEISKAISSTQIALSEYKRNTISELEELVDNSNFHKAIQASDLNYIENHLSNNTKYENITIYDAHNNLIHGVSWDLINKYYYKILSSSSKDLASSFVAKHGNKIYLISFQPIFDTSNDYLGLAIHVELNQSQILSSKHNYPIHIIPFLTEKMDVTNLKLTSSDLRSQLKLMKSENLNKIIFRKDSENAFGLFILKDLIGLPQAVVCISYYRAVNNFTSSGLIFFVLIILAFSLLIISAMGLWFSKSIMQPVKEISEQMIEISRNPSEIKPFTEKFSGVLGDLTEVYNKMSNSLITNREKLVQYKAITDNINVGIFFMDEHQNIIVCNPAFKEIFSVKDDRPLNLSELTKIDPAKLLDIGSSYSHNYYFALKKSSINKYLILDLNMAKEEKIKYFGSITDETSLVKSRKTKQALELELIKSNRLAKIGKLLVGVVHNLNSPLNSIVGYSQFLKKDFPENQDIDRLYRSSKKISSMVKGLLNKNSNENRSMPQNINVNNVIEDELEMCEYNLFFKHYVIVEKNLSKEIKYTNAVYSDISLCIANIFNNAFDAMQNSPQKELIIKTYMTDNYITLQITDSGHGIPNNKLDKIFNINYTSKTNNKNSGYGLGLALTKTIIEKCNGKIEVESQIEKGTTFKLFFPKM